jgi:hypothetical protein
MKSIVYADGLLTSSGQFDSKRDYSLVGADVYIQDAKGTKYNNIFTRYGRFEALHLSLTEKPLSLVVKVPGHFKTIYDFKIGMKNSEGEMIGQFKRLDVPTSLGGDVNGDDVIDIMDAVEIQTNWETNHREADINFDGTVDAKDMAFVEKNYLKQNPSIETAPKPKHQHMGKTLAEIKNQLGLN